jgi:hypothetical protein
VIVLRPPSQRLALSAPPRQRVKESHRGHPRQNSVGPLQRTFELADSHSNGVERELVDLAKCAWKARRERHHPRADFAHLLGAVTLRQSHRQHLAIFPPKLVEGG